jgi:hypothetical protein
LSYLDRFTPYVEKFLGRQKIELGPKQETSPSRPEKPSTRKRKAAPLLEKSIQKGG